MRPAGYLRVSSEEQRERQTILTQEEFLTRYFDLHNIQGVEWYRDDGVTGTIPLEERPEGRRLLEEVKAGRVSAVYVFRIDRLARSPRVLHNAVHALEEAHCRLVSATEMFDTGDPAGRAMLGMLAVFAGFERDSITARCVAGTERAVREGQWLGGERPYGYVIKGQGKDARIVPNDTLLPDLPFSEVDVVRLIFRLCAEERYPCARIADHLNAHAIPTMFPAGSVLSPRTGRPNTGRWMTAVVARMLHNRVYCGVHEYGKDTKRKRGIIPRAVPPLVDVETWEQAQEVIRANRATAKRNLRFEYLLRGKLWCAQCQRPYHATAFKGRKKHYCYYFCPNLRPPRYEGRTERCPSGYLPVSVEEKVWTEVVAFIRNPGPVLEKLAREAEDQSMDAQKHEAELARLEGLLAAKAQERDTILTLFRRKRIDETSLDRQLDAIAREESTLHAEYTTLVQRRQALATSRERLTEAASLLRSLVPEVEGEVPFARRRHLVETLVEKITPRMEEGESVLHIDFRF